MPVLSLPYDCNKGAYLNQLYPTYVFDTKLFLGFVHHKIHLWSYPFSITDIVDNYNNQLGMITKFNQTL